jgi:hypothetical protein
MKDVGAALFFIDRTFERFHLTANTSHLLRSPELDVLQRGTGFYY